MTRTPPDERGPPEPGEPAPGSEFTPAEMVDRLAMLERALEMSRELAEAAVNDAQAALAESRAECERLRERVWVLEALRLIWFEAHGDEMSAISACWAHRDRILAPERRLREAAERERDTAADRVRAAIEVLEAPDPWEQRVNNARRALTSGGAAGDVLAPVSSDHRGSLSIGAPGFTTIRACRECGVLQTGGPTLCVACARAGLGKQGADSSEATSSAEPGDVGRMQPRETQAGRPSQGGLSPLPTASPGNADSLLCWCDEGATEGHAHCPAHGTNAPRNHHLKWSGIEWVDDRCGCRYHPDDDNGSHGGAPHVHRCEHHATPDRTPRDETKPPPGFRWDVDDETGAVGDMLRRDEKHARHWSGDEQMTIAEAWAIYDREHNFREPQVEQRSAAPKEEACTPTTGPAAPTATDPPSTGTSRAATSDATNGEPATSATDVGRTTSTSKSTTSEGPADSTGQPCPDCNGRGGVHGWNCETCGGSGQSPSDDKPTSVFDVFSDALIEQGAAPEPEDRSEPAKLAEMGAAQSELLAEYKPSRAAEWVLTACNERAMLNRERRLRETAERERDSWHEKAQLAEHETEYQAQRAAAAERRAGELGSVIDEACRTLAGHGWVCGGASLVEAVENACMAGKVAARRAEEAEQCRRLEREARENAERERDETQAKRAEVERNYLGLVELGGEDGRKWRIVHANMSDLRERLAAAEGRAGEARREVETWQREYAGACAREDEERTRADAAVTDRDRLRALLAAHANGRSSAPQPDDDTEPEC